MPTLLYGCEAWSLREDLFKRLRSFHNRCARSMCRVCWSMGHPCSIQRGLARRLCILLVCTGDSLKSYHHARKKKLYLPRNEKIRSWCESTGKCELRSRKRNRNELRVYASCAPCKHGRAQDGWECWSMGHPPCSIQRGLTRRLCILLVCTDPLSTH